MADSRRCQVHRMTDCEECHTQGTPDRPAAELLAELRESRTPSVSCVPWARLERALERLARAEQALAEKSEEIAAITARAQGMLSVWPGRLADAWDEGWDQGVEDHYNPIDSPHPNPYRAALRATQGGQ